MSRDAVIKSDDAYEVISEMEVKQRIELDGVDIYFGKHPVHGEIRIILPMSGDGFLLYPFEVHSI